MSLIDVDAAKEKAIEKWTPVGSEVVSDFLDDQPTIDAVPVLHAHWTDKGSLSCRCSHCGCKANDEFPYCPRCYARMDEQTKI